MYGTSKEYAYWKDYFQFRRDSHLDLMIQFNSSNCLDTVFEELIDVTYTLELDFFGIIELFTISVKYTIESSESSISRLYPTCKPSCLTVDPLI